MSTKKARLWIIITLICLLLIGVLSIFLGRYPKFPGLTPGQLSKDVLAQNLVLRLRIPRVLFAVLLGMCLSVAGYVMQMIFRNPLIEPGFLGVSQGAAFGAAFSILFVATAPLLVELSAVIFAFFGLLLSYLISQKIRVGDSMLKLILAGIAVTALFSAGVGMLKYLADPVKQLPDLVFWLLGSLSTTRWENVLYVLPIILVGLLIIYAFRWRINILALEDPIARSLGANLKLERTILLGAAVIISGAVIAVAGIISWVGLIIPHITRLLVGPNPRIGLPMTILLGGIFTLVCDDLARVMIAGEIPLGILTSLLGAIIFIALLAGGKVPLRQADHG